MSLATDLRADDRRAPKLAPSARPAPKARRPRVVGARLNGRASTVVAVGWLAFVIAHLSLSGHWWLWSVVDLMPPPLFLAMPLLLLVFCAGWRARLITATALLFGLGLSGLNPSSPSALFAAGDPGPGGIRIVSWNPEFWAQADDPERFYAYLRDADADVYLLQEYLHSIDGPVEIDEEARLRQEFPQYQLIRAGELVTLSRLPVVHSVPLDADAQLTRAGLPVPADAPFRAYQVIKTLRTDVMVGDQIVSIYNTHQPVHVDTRISPLRAAFYEVPREQFARRQVHLDLLHQDLASNPNPVLLAGDFNASPVSGELARLKTDLVDAVGAASQPYPYSWQFHGLPLWRLDWVFTSRCASSSPCVIVDGYQLLDQQGLSDHRLQEVTVRVSGN